MIEIENKIIQPRPYADHVGEVYVLCETGENEEDVMKKYVEPKREWHETSYTYVKTLKEHEFNDWKGNTIKYKGIIVVLYGKQIFLD